MFRAEDRSALPVTDSAGVLIGIVTVDDMLDVAEAAATEDIQRFGGTEALDEPYMEIGFGRMIQKRAGWLTALFLGEMLTATAMARTKKRSSVPWSRPVRPAHHLERRPPGSQADRLLVIRALALGECACWAVAVIRREFAAGLVLGGILGTVDSCGSRCGRRFPNIYGVHWFLVALTVGIGARRVCVGD